MLNNRPEVTGLLRRARAQRTGVGAFNVVVVEHAEAIVAGAVEAVSPVILQISENTIRYHGSAAPVIRACLAMAAAAPVAAYVHLDHITDPSLIDIGLDEGVDSVMFDGSRLPFDENVRQTAAIVEKCRLADVAVEAELGEVGGKDGVHSPTARTDPHDARRFVADTGVDWLAIAVGSSHAMTERVATLDLALIGEIRTTVDVPLVLHGSSGVDDVTLAAAVTAGISKVNISTYINKLFTGHVRRVLDSDPRVVDPRKYMAPARDAVSKEIARLLRMLAKPQDVASVWR